MESWNDKRVDSYHPVINGCTIHNTTKTKVGDILRTIFQIGSVFYNSRFTGGSEEGS